MIFAIIAKIFYGEFYEKTSTILLISLLTFLGCSDSKKEQDTVIKVQNHNIETTEKITPNKQYTLDEIYITMCITCHSHDGSGNVDKLTPSITGKTQQEIQQALTDIENDTGHIVMEHNRGEILKMGMQYSAKEMSLYMDERFN
ncbi:MAG: hypothetical protein U9N02_01485 [Campylobacterota bacterium]|nr:hypothetical protein [Campylobacterota bacterium]